MDLRATAIGFEHPSAFAFFQPSEEFSTWLEPAGLDYLLLSTAQQLIASRKPTKGFGMSRRRFSVIDTSLDRRML